MKNALLKNFLEKMQLDIQNEYKHLHFYLYAFANLKGLDRLHLGNFFESQANSELEHVKQFGKKISAFGLIPNGPLVTEFSFPTITADSLLIYAMQMELEVLENYHKRLIDAENLHQQSNNYKDLVLFYEDHIEHTSEDLDEIYKLLGFSRV